MIVPRTLRQFILSQLYERFFWYALKRDVDELCLRCEICCSSKMSHKHAKAHMKQDNLELPMERVAIDFMGTLTKTKPQNGNAPKRYLMIISPNGQKQSP